MTTNEDGVIRFDAKLASVARDGKRAMVCFYVRGQDADLDALAKAREAELILGVVIAREVLTADGISE